MAAIEAVVEIAFMTAMREEGENADELEIGLLITDDDTIRQLNRDYRGINAPTDVLAFSMREGEDAEHYAELLGDLVISVPTAARQADERGHSTAYELAFLAVHGTLHLLGYDHMTDDEAESMEAREAEIMVRLTNEPNWLKLDSRLRNSFGKGLD